MEPVEPTLIVALIRLVPWLVTGVLLIGGTLATRRYLETRLSSAGFLAAALFVLALGWLVSLVYGALFVRLVGPTPQDVARSVYVSNAVLFATQFLSLVGYVLVAVGASKVRRG